MSGAFQAKGPRPLTYRKLRLVLWCLWAQLHAVVALSQAGIRVGCRGQVGLKEEGDVSTGQAWCCNF